MREEPKRLPTSDQLSNSPQLHNRFQLRLGARFKISPFTIQFWNFKISWIRLFLLFFLRVLGFFKKRVKMVDSMSSLSCSEITRNPFDSGIEDRTNCPDFSPSMFSIQETPGSQKV